MQFLSQLALPAEDAMVINNFDQLVNARIRSCPQKTPDNCERQAILLNMSCSEHLQESIAGMSVDLLFHNRSTY
eukprot:scaffold319209_cov18-Tisochrysis_lutea.AAC.1